MREIFFEVLKLLGVEHISNQPKGVRHPTENPFA